MTTRVRFAPSPTGFLHIGGVRTSLFNWLYARHHGGINLLRIEDTDLERSEARYTDDILACLEWLGLSWDEPIVYQSKRLGHYAAIADQWVKDGKAYWCTCSEADVEAMRERALKEGRKPKYDGTCREKNHPSGKGAIRAKLPLDGDVSFHDLIHGDVTFHNADLDDLVLVRSSGATTYNFSVVVDDAEMKVTDVIRGDDHLNNTPKQVHLYAALGAPVPRFAHLPMILGTDKKKLSKRHGDVSANVYREQGFLPSALLNFLVRLGWSHGDQEVFTLEEMVRLFDFDHVQKSAAVFNPEKLLWLNGAHLRTTKPEELRAILKRDFAGGLGPMLDRPEGLRLIEHSAAKVKKVTELAEQIGPLTVSDLPVVDPGTLKWNKNPEQIPVIKKATAALIAGLLPLAGNVTTSLEIHGVTREQIETLVKTVCEAHGIKIGDLAEPVRLSVTGRLVSIGLYEVILSMPWPLLQARLARVEGF